MSLDKINQYITQLEAVKKYDEVKKQKDNLLISHKSLNQRVYRLTEEVKILKNDIVKRVEMIDRLKLELDTVNQKALNLKRRIQMLEKFKATAEGKTVKEAEKLFLKAREKEITGKATRLYNRMKVEWEEKERPRESLDHACMILQTGLTTGYWLKQLDEKGVSDRITNILEKEVKSRLDNEFNRRVEENSHKESEKKLAYKITVEWPKWLKENIEPKIDNLHSLITTNALKLLEGPWDITCDKCSTPQTIQFTADRGIPDLLRNTTIHIPCTNPDCKDFLGRHLIKVNLNFLLENRLT